MMTLVCVMMVSCTRDVVVTTDPSFINKSAFRADAVLKSHLVGSRRSTDGTGRDFHIL